MTFFLTFFDILYSDFFLKLFSTYYIMTFFTFLTCYALTFLTFFVTCYTMTFIFFDILYYDFYFFWHTILLLYFYDITILYTIQYLCVCMLNHAVLHWVHTVPLYTDIVCFHQHLSQFWYSDDTAAQLAEEAIREAGEGGR